MMRSAIQTANSRAPLGNFSHAPSRFWKLPFWVYFTIYHTWRAVSIFVLPCAHQQQDMVVHFTAKLQFSDPRVSQELVSEVLTEMLHRVANVVGVPGGWWGVGASDHHEPVGLMVLAG